MDAADETNFTIKRNTDTLDKAAEVAAGLSRRPDDEVWRITNQRISAARAKFADLGVIAEADLQEKIEAEAEVKIANQKLAAGIASAILYAEAIGDLSLSRMKVEGDDAGLIESMIIPGLHRVDSSHSNSTADFLAGLVKAKRQADKVEAKATEKAKASNSRWSAVYGEVTDLWREGRALQVSRGFDVPKVKRKANRKEDDESETPVVEEAESPEVVAVRTDDAPKTADDEVAA